MSKHALDLIIWNRRKLRDDLKHTHRHTGVFFIWKNMFEWCKFRNWFKLPFPDTVVYPKLNSCFFHLFRWFVVDVKPTGNRNSSESSLLTYKFNFSSVSIHLLLSSCVSVISVSLAPFSSIRNIICSKMVQSLFKQIHFKWECVFLQIFNASNNNQFEMCGLVIISNAAVDKTQSTIHSLRWHRISRSN